MIKITFVVPIESQVELVYDVYKEHEKEYDALGRDGYEYEFSVCAAEAIEDVPPPVFDADILIARGLMATELKTAHRQAAVVDVPIGSELVSVIYQAVQQYGRLPIGVSGSFNVLHSTHGISDVLHVDLKTYFQPSVDYGEIDKMIDDMIADGRRILVCGPVAYNRALLRDCHAIYLGMSRDSIWQAISEAKTGAAIKRSERERAEQFSTVLNYAFEGVIATDAAGRITVFNAAASDILKIAPGIAHGKLVEDILFPGQLLSTLRDNSEYTDKIITHRGELLSVNKAGIMLGDDFAGYVATMQKSASVQKTEGKIREKLYAKGLVAKYSFADIIGDSPAIRRVVGKAKHFASVDSNIMILGGTGTGKEMFAQSIHNQSARSPAPFVAINCAALSKSLLESELFGYVEGAFTGAKKGGRPGLFEIAHSGTIFLDEISEIPLDLQGRLLRVLQERQIMRLGDDKIIPIDVRIVSAANKPLLDEVRLNRFRRDLYYRLNVLGLQLPPLNRRGDDILRLAELFLIEFSERFGKKAPALSAEARERLLGHNWEGNIRELRNACEYLAVLNETGILYGEDVDEALSPDGSGFAEANPRGRAGKAKLFDREAILAALEEHKNDRQAAAKMLGISRSTLWRWMRQMQREEG